MASRVCRRLLIALALLAGTLTPTLSAARTCEDGGRPYPDEGGIGGTGVRPAAPEDEGGVGGTAARPSAPDDEGGIGGTGIAVHGDTGIIGTITGFGSICVGGVEIHYAPETPVEMDGHRATAAQLGVGQVVEVVASGTGDEVTARQIVVRHVVSGPVTRIDAERDTIEVLGQTVQLSAATRSDPAAGGATVTADSFHVGDAVQVSGERRSDETIVASRVTRRPAGDAVRLSGPVTRSEHGGLGVAGVAVHAARAATLRVGEHVTVEGRWDGAGITARSVTASPRLPFDGRVARVDVEGYPAGPIESGRMRVGHFQITLPQDAPAPSADARVRLRAVVRDRQVIAERLTVIGDFRPPSLPNGGAGRTDKPQSVGAPDRDANGNLDRPDARHGAGDGDAIAPPRPESAPGSGAERPPERGAGGMPPRPDRPQDIPARPDGPPRVDRPPLPDRADRPPRPDPPEPPPRPVRPDRPPERPEIPHHAGRR